jgi:hypothetical protein
MNLFANLKMPRIIDQLREQFPGKWTWDARDGSWRHGKGWRVREFAAMVGEDSYETQFRRSDTSEIVPVYRGRRTKKETTRDRLLKLAEALCVKPTKKGPRLEWGYGRWWLTGTIGGDTALPGTAKAKTDDEALDIIEKWIRRVGKK